MEGALDERTSAVMEMGRGIATKGKIIDSCSTGSPITCAVESSSPCDSVIFENPMAAGVTRGMEARRFCKAREVKAG